MTEPPNETNAPEPRPGHEVNPQPPTDPRKQVLAHVRCADCNYDLFGHTANSTCPECGLPIQKTLLPRNPEHPYQLYCNAIRLVRVHALLATLLACMPFAGMFLFREMINTAFYPSSSPGAPCVFLFVLVFLLADPIMALATLTLMWQCAESRSRTLQAVPTPKAARVLILALIPLGAVVVWYSSMPIPLAYVIFRLIAVAELVNQGVRCANRLDYPNLVASIMAIGSIVMVCLVMIAAGMIMWSRDGWALIGLGMCGIWLAAISTCYFTTEALSAIKK